MKRNLYRNIRIKGGILSSDEENQLTTFLKALMILDHNLKIVNSFYDSKSFKKMMETLYSLYKDDRVIFPSTLDVYTRLRTDYMFMLDKNFALKTMIQRLLDVVQA